MFKIIKHDLLPPQFKRYWPKDSASLLSPYNTIFSTLRKCYISFGDEGVLKSDYWIIQKSLKTNSITDKIQ